MIRRDQTFDVMTVNDNLYRQWTMAVLLFALCIRLGTALVVMINVIVMSRYNGISHSWCIIVIIIITVVVKNRINPLSPHDALKHHFTSMKTYLTFLKQRVLEQKFLWNWFTNTWQFSLILNHIKSSSSTTSRELRQQFAACSGCRWQW